MHLIDFNLTVQSCKDKSNNSEAEPEHFQGPNRKSTDVCMKQKMYFS